MGKPTDTVGDLLDRMRKRLGPPPRSPGVVLRKLHRIQPPDWLDTNDPKVAGLFADSEQLLTYGKLVWAHVVHANERLFKPDFGDLPAALVYSMDGFYDDRVTTLGRVAHALFNLKGQRYRNSEIDLFARVLTSETETLFNTRVPASIAPGPHVYYTSAILHRRLFPEGYLAHNWFPVLTMPGFSPTVMVLSCSLWPALLTGIWRQRRQPEAEVEDQQEDADENFEDPTSVSP
ncbi:MAG TPA: hypothetical protein VN493_08755 [Thermoanaerobaculia bacterium]|nr:hypothetical protein [Thermoanaerobaculia bacterium]